MFITLFLIIIIPLIAVVIDAYTDKKNILNIKHLRGAIIYSVVVAIPYLFFFINAVAWHHLVVIPILTRAAIFDPLLNLMTGNPFNYNGYKDNPKRSLIDKIEDSTGLSIFWIRAIYIKLYTSYLTFFIIKYVN